jgi:uncharacterized protein (TIGR03000 family)
MQAALTVRNAGSWRSLPGSGPARCDGFRHDVARRSRRGRLLASLLVICGCLVLGPACAGARDPAAVSTPSGGSRVTSQITVTVPHDDAQLVVEGQAVPGSGPSRVVSTPALERNATHRYTLTATWQPNGYTTMTRTRTIAFRSGEAVAVDLSADDPSDRVRVIYVPTPESVAQEMVTLAGVTRDDVVFEPGCGDARITIAAVRRGARRGVGIDIDPARVDESRALVKEAGLDDRVEIRLGDALEIPDLSSATVVFLYMGDHFNLLIRPILWRDLPVGARVVSHRFTMGDWKPDRTVTVGGDEGYDYELHLWTITEELKKKAE